MRKLILCASQIKECTMYNICYAGETGFFKQLQSLEIVTSATDKLTYLKSR